MYQAQALKQYQQNSANGAVDASPHKLIGLLMQKALDRMVAAKGCMERNDFESRNTLLNKCIDTVHYLSDCLDHKYDKEMTARFEQLYDYMGFRLFQANSQNDAKAVDEVHGLLGGIYETWQEAGKLEGKVPVSSIVETAPTLHK